MEKLLWVYWEEIDGPWFSIFLCYQSIFFAPSHQPRPYLSVSILYHPKRVQVQVLLRIKASLESHWTLYAKIPTVLTMTIITRSAKDHPNCYWFCFDCFCIDYQFTIVVMLFMTKEKHERTINPAEVEEDVTNNQHNCRKDLDTFIKVTMKDPNKLSLTLPALSICCPTNVCQVLVLWLDHLLNFFLYWFFLRKREKKKLHTPSFLSTLRGYKFPLFFSWKWLWVLIVQNGKLQVTANF